MAFYYVYKEGVDMKLSDHLDTNIRRKLKNLSSKSKDKPVKKIEKLNDKDLADLTGIHRDRYERKGGAVRKK